MSRHEGWVTLHELLEETGLPYRQLMELAERGDIPSRRSGQATLYRLDALSDLSEPAR
jgi:hypothetical protein